MEETPTSVTLLFTLALILSGTLWLVALQRVMSGQVLLPFEPRRHVPWGLIDLLIAFMLLLVATAGASYFLQVTGISSPTDTQDETTALPSVARILANSVATLLATFAILVVISLKNGANLRDIGIELQPVPRDLVLGVVAFFMLAGPVFLIQALLVTWWPSVHPLVELVKANPDPQFFLVVGFSAVIVAPFAEEYLFRVFLQGWLEKLALFRGDPSYLLFGGPSDPVRPPVGKKSENEDSTVDVDSLIDDRPIDANPYAPPKSQQPEPDHLNRDLVKPSYWPLFVSATIFALMHYSHGPDPIPLFVLALGLGYLYQRTHRVLPCIVVHLLLNATSVLVLLLSV